MRTYQIEIMGYVYVTIPVKANSLEEAQDAALNGVPRRPVVVTIADGMPAGTEVSVSKDWEVNDS